MVLNKQDFFIKAGLLVAAVAVSSLHWSITMNPDGEALFHLGYLLAFVISVPIIAIIPGALFFGVAALTMDRRTRDHTRACFLMGLYVVALLMVCFNVIKISDMPRPPSAKGGGNYFWYILYVMAFIYSLPGVRVTATQQEIDQEKARRQQIAQRPGINRWLLVTAGSLIVFTIFFLPFWGVTDLDYALMWGGFASGGFAVLFGLGMLMNDAVFGRLRFWKITFPRLVRDKTRRRKAIDWSAMSIVLIDSGNWNGLLLLADDWLTAERGNHESWAAKGLAYEMLGDFHKAISAYQVSLKILYDETVAKRLDALVEERMRQTRAREERERKTKAEDGRLEPMAAAELKQLGRYDLTGILGKGAMGIVYEGLDSKLHRKVAIKTILKSALDLDSAKEFTMRFAREAQAVARLNYPHIVPVYDFGEQGEIAYIVMEFIKGKELKNFFDENERFELKEAVRIMCELCDALHFAHEAGIVHCDIRPGNVMLDSQARVKLAGFGVARIIGADAGENERGKVGTRFGAPAYMSPEQITGADVDRRSDIFSAGVILYQFLTGEKPFTGSGSWTIAKKIIQDDPRPPSSINKTISPLFDAVVNKALAKSVEQRYQSAREFGAALKRALEGRSQEDGRTREQKTRHSTSNSDYASGGRTSNSAHVNHYFRILEIQPGATINEVKAAYRRQMQQYHPDRVASLGKELRDLAEAKSKEINAAYRAIMNALSAAP